MRKSFQKDEIQQSPDYTKKENREAEFNASHAPALATEGKILSELRGDIAPSSRLSIPSTPKKGYQTVTYSYDGGKAKYEFQQGATSTTTQITVNVGGIPMKANETTVKPTGELKSVKKIQ